MDVQASSGILQEYISCPLCGADDSRLVYAIDMAKVKLSTVWIDGQSCTVTEPARIVECHRCHLRYVNPRIALRPGQMPYSIEHENEHFARSYEARLLMSRNLVSELPRLLGRRPSSLLDIGCGDGVLLDVALDQGIRCAGIEVSSNLLSQLRARFRERAIIASDVSLLPDDVYDVVTLISVLEHVHEPYQVLNAALSRLAPDGALIVNVPNSAGIPARLYGPRWDQIEPLAHLFYFTAQTLTAMLERAGLRVTRRFTMTCRMDLTRRDALSSLRRAAYWIEMYLGTDLGLVARR
ncbi:MAG: class I SAM-dependent methyltransferase [Roseiflexaceae bacterium]|nr:class I SAM-dependent methyltransferase [Roseiflexus sp.]MDW8234254.1 class I SAM-dependent methyltransferase [Roseiflexaceae bacterium]